MQKRNLLLLSVWQNTQAPCPRTLQLHGYTQRRMEPNTRAASRWATPRALALPEIWTLVAQHSGLVGAWRLTGACRASREGARVWLRTLPGFVVCGGLGRDGECKSGVWRLDLGELRWEHIGDLALARAYPACCAVRGGVAMLRGLHTQHRPGENEPEDCFTASVEFFEHADSLEVGEQIKSKTLPPLSCGPRVHAAAVPVHESQSELGQVLLIGGVNIRSGVTPEVHRVDLATGVCTPLPPLLSRERVYCNAARLPDGRVVCVGNDAEGMTAEILEEVAPDQGSLTGQSTWRWREVCGMTPLRLLFGGCVLGDGRFAVFGGITDRHTNSHTTACEVLTSVNGDDERWEPLRPMHDARFNFACAAVGGCVIVAGGESSGSVEVYEEALRQWRQLPCNLPYDANIYGVGSALM